MTAHQGGGTPSPVRMVWCDFGGVLTTPVAAAFASVVAATGVPGAVLRAAVGQVAAELGMEQLEPLERGLLSQREWGHRVTRALAPRWTPRADLSELGTHWYAGHSANRPLLDGLAALKRRGLRLGLLTNSVREWEPHRRALAPADGLFDATIRSHETGLRKPDPEIYALAEATAGVDGSACLLVDDLPVNCAAARARGWSTVVHTSTTSTLAQLHRHGHQAEPPRARTDPGAPQGEGPHGVPIPIVPPGSGGLPDQS